MKIEIVGIRNGNHGQRCKNQSFCGQIVKPGMILKFCSIETVNDNQEKENINEVFALEGGQETCMVFFLLCYAARHKTFYHGRFMKLTKIAFQIR